MFYRLIHVAALWAFSAVGSIGSFPPSAAPGLCRDGLATNNVPIAQFAVSPSPDGFFTVALEAIQGRLYRFHDRIERVGAVNAAVAWTVPLMEARVPWEKVVSIAIGSDPDGEPVVGVVDHAGHAFLVWSKSQIVQIEMDGWPHGISISSNRRGPSAPQVAIFTDRGIRLIDLPKRRASRKSLLASSGFPLNTRQGVALRRNDFLVLDSHQRLQRVSTVGVRIAPIELPPGVIVRSFSAYLENGEPVIWLVDLKGGLWLKTSTQVPFELFHANLPQGVKAAQVAASVTPANSANADFLESSFLTYMIKPRGRGTWGVRILIVGDDNLVYHVELNSGGELKSSPVVTDFGSTLSREDRAYVNQNFPGVLERVGATALDPEHFMQQVERLSTVPSNLRKAALSAWVTRINHLRAFGPGDGGLAHTLSGLGVPQARDARLIFLDSIPDLLLAPLLRGSITLEESWTLSSVHEALAGTTRDFLTALELPDGKTEQSMVFFLTEKLGKRGDPKTVSRLKTSLARETSSVYLAFNRFLQDEDVLWEWHPIEADPKQ